MVQVQQKFGRSRHSQSGQETALRKGKRVTVQDLLFRVPHIRKSGGDEEKAWECDCAKKGQQQG